MLVKIVLLLEFRVFMLHSEILISLNFTNIKILYLGLENNHTLKCCSSNFSTNSHIRNCSKHGRQTFQCTILFSSLGDKVIIHVESRDIFVL